MASRPDVNSTPANSLVAVEVKTTLMVRDVDHFLDTLRHSAELIPEYAGRAVYGAVAYLKEDESSGTYAERQGLFVIRATGSSASITTARTSGRARLAANPRSAVPGSRRQRRRRVYREGTSAESARAVSTMRVQAASTCSRRVAGEPTARRSTNRSSSTVWVR